MNPLRPPLLAAPLTFLCIATLAAQSLVAETYVVGPQNYLDAIEHLAPGDQLILEAGFYREGLPVRSVKGTKDAPVVIRGPQQGKPAILLGRPGANTVSIANSSHVILSDLLLDGNDLPVDAVVTESRSGLVHHITLERLIIIGHGHDQSVVAIGTRCPTAFWAIRDNLIIGAGTGMYLGGSNGGAPFVAGVIEGNVVLDTVGYNIQIKHQNRERDLPGLPQTPQVTLIHGNFLSKASGASQGEMARPNLLLGHFPATGAGSQDAYRVVNNILYYNPTEVLMQGEGNIEASDNIYLNPVGSAVSIQPHHDVPRQIEIRENFIAAASVGVRIQGGDSAHRQVVESNAVYAGSPLSGGLQRHNVTGPFAELDPQLSEWLSRKDVSGVEKASDWERILKRMTHTVCEETDSLADISGSVAADEGVRRSCRFLGKLFRLAVHARGG